MSSAGEKRSAEEADIEIVEYDGPESLRGVEIVPTDSVERLFTWKNCMSVNGVHLKNKWEHPELLVRMLDIAIAVIHKSIVSLPNNNPSIALLIIYL